MIEQSSYPLQPAEFHNDGLPVFSGSFKPVSARDPRFRCFLAARAAEGPKLSCCVMSKVCFTAATFFDLGGSAVVFLHDLLGRQALLSPPGRPSLYVSSWFVGFTGIRRLGEPEFRLNQEAALVLCVLDS